MHLASEYPHLRSFKIPSMGSYFAMSAALPSLRQMRRLESRLFWRLLLRRLGAGEGSSSAEELLYLVRVARNAKARSIAEIGFNAGCSSYALLRYVPDATVVSFDLGEHASIAVNKKLIDKKFPGRHTLISGDSRETVPAFADSNPDLRFDLVFIDGGHDYEVAHADIVNMRLLSSDSTALVMDDLVPWASYGAGPTKAWEEAVRDEFVRQEELFQHGERVEKAQPPGARAWALGRYVF
jgi:predicted O-methyltransferase YrrM